MTNYGKQCRFRLPNAGAGIVLLTLVALPGLMT